MSETKLRALSDFESSPELTGLEKAVLRYAAALSETPARVAPALFEDLRAHFDEGQLVELTSAIAWENYRARFNRAFEIPAEGFSKGAFCPLPAGGAVRGD